MQPVNQFLEDAFFDCKQINIGDLASGLDLIEEGILDSLMWMNLLMKIEEVYEVEMDIEVLIAQKTFLDLSIAIENTVNPSLEQ